MDNEIKTQNMVRLVQLNMVESAKEMLYMMQFPYSYVVTVAGGIFFEDLFEIRKEGDNWKLLEFVVGAPCTLTTGQLIEIMEKVKNLLDKKYGKRK